MWQGGSQLGEDHKDEGGEECVSEVTRICSGVNLSRADDTRRAYDKQSSAGDVYVPIAPMESIATSRFKGMRVGFLILAAMWATFLQSLVYNNLSFNGRCVGPVVYPATASAEKAGGIPYAPSDIPSDERELPAHDSATKRPWFPARPGSSGKWDDNSDQISTTPVEDQVGDTDGTGDGDSAEPETSPLDPRYDPSSWPIKVGPTVPDPTKTGILPGDLLGKKANRIANDIANDGDDNENNDQEELPTRRAQETITEWETPISNNPTPGTSNPLPGPISMAPEEIDPTPDDVPRTPDEIADTPENTGGLFQNRKERKAAQSESQEAPSEFREAQSESRETQIESQEAPSEFREAQSESRETQSESRETQSESREPAEMSRYMSEDIIQTNPMYGAPIRRLQALGFKTSTEVPLRSLKMTGAIRGPQNMITDEGTDNVLPWRDAIKSEALFDSPYVTISPLIACSANLAIQPQERCSFGKCAADHSWPPSVQSQDILYSSGGRFDTTNISIFSALGELDTNMLREYGEYWRVFWAMFLHQGWIHILANSIILLQCSYVMEPEWGTIRFLVIFVIGGVIGNLLSVWRQPCVASIGASGAIYALGSSMLVYALEYWDYLFRPIPYLLSGAFTIIMGTATTMWLNESVDVYAHLGGLIAGVIVGLATIRAVTVTKDNVLLRLCVTRPMRYLVSSTTRTRLFDSAYTHCIERQKADLISQGNIEIQNAKSVQNHQIKASIKRIYTHFKNQPPQMDNRRRFWATRIFAWLAIVVSIIIIAVMALVPSIYASGTVVWQPTIFNGNRTCTCCNVRDAVSGDPVSSALAGRYWCFKNDTVAQQQCATMPT